MELLLEEPVREPERRMPFPVREEHRRGVVLRHGLEELALRAGQVVEAVVEHFVVFDQGVPLAAQHRFRGEPSHARGSQDRHLPERLEVLFLDAEQTEEAVPLRPLRQQVREMLLEMTGVHPRVHQVADARAERPGQAPGPPRLAGQEAVHDLVVEEPVRHQIILTQPRRVQDLESQAVEGVEARAQQGQALFQAQETLQPLGQAPGRGDHRDASARRGEVLDALGEGVLERGLEGPAEDLHPSRAAKAWASPG